MGRTGTLLAARFLLERLRSNPEVIDIFGTILSLRKWRPNLVQTPVRNIPLARRFFIVKNPITIVLHFAKAQLKFLYEFVQFCIEKEGLFQEDQDDTTQGNYVYQGKLITQRSFRIR